MKINRIKSKHGWRFEIIDDVIKEKFQGNIMKKINEARSQAKKAFIKKHTDRIKDKGINELEIKKLKESISRIEKL